MAGVMLCEATCYARYRIGAHRHSSRPAGPGGCTRKATYTDGTNVYCTQHAKEPPTPLAPASGRIRSDCRKLDD